MKLKNTDALLAEAGVQLDKWGTGKFSGRHVRWLPSLKVIEFGSLDFDRWANSKEESFDVSQKIGQRQFLRYAKLLELDTVDVN